LLYPVMPGKMIELRKVLGLSDSAVNSFKTEWGMLEKAKIASESVILFPKVLETPDTGKITENGEVEGVMQIEYADFQKVELKTAKIVGAAKVEGADKLLVLQIEIGEERRQIVAGIAKWYKPEDIIGRTIVVVANLKPAKIRGVESNGMLLAASCGDMLKLITVDGDMPSGAIVK